MATTYVGYYRVTESAAREIETANRETGAAPRVWAEKVNAFPASLPDGVKLIGSWGVGGGVAPSVMIVEVDDFSGLAHINAYYAGWLAFDWHPTNAGGVPRDL